MQTNNTNFTLRLTSEDREILEKAAKSKRISTASLIRSIVFSEIERTKEVVMSR